MTATDHQNSSDHSTEQSQNATSQKSHGFFYNVCENLDNTVKKATDRASAKACRAVPKLKRIVERGAHKVSYSAAYGVVFGVSMARHLWKDNAILEGVKGGVKAGRSAAENRSAKPAQASQAAGAEVASLSVQPGSDDDALAAGVKPSPA
jgi:hypothetical protein